LGCLAPGGGLLFDRRQAPLTRHHVVYYCSAVYTSRKRQPAWAFRSPNYPPRCEVSGEQRLVKTGGRLVKHARYYWLLLAESHLTRQLFGSMVRRIDALAVATG